MDIKTLKLVYQQKKPQIQKRLEDFKKFQSLEDKEIFPELCFCILTPQSKALNCWDAVLELKEQGLLEKGDHKNIGKILRKKVRFHNNKAKYIVKNRKLFFEKNINEKILTGKSNKENRNFFESNMKGKIFNGKSKEETRDWLVENIKGYGYKEASHFLRNIGFRNLAILDRHILKNLVSLDVIDKIPKNLNKKNYLEIEKKFQQFSEKIGIPMDELDLLFWYTGTGRVFK